MTSDQISGLIRQLVTLFGAIATTLGFTIDLGPALDLVLQIAGPIGVIIAAVWSWVANTKSSIVASVAAMDETTVDGNRIVLNDPNLARTARAASASATA